MLESVNRGQWLVEFNSFASRVLRSKYRILRNWLRATVSIITLCVIVAIIVLKLGTLVVIDKENKRTLDNVKKGNSKGMLRDVDTNDKYYPDLIFCIFRGYMHGSPEDNSVLPFNLSKDITLQEAIYLIGSAVDDQPPIRHKYDGNLKCNETDPIWSDDNFINCVDSLYCYSIMRRGEIDEINSNNTETAIYAKPVKMKYAINWIYAYIKYDGSDIIDTNRAKEYFKLNNENIDRILQNDDKNITRGEFCFLLREAVEEVERQQYSHINN